MAGRGVAMELFPPMPLADWADTKATVHRFCQVVGKIRLAASVRRNHWWNVPFHLTWRGITTRPMGQVDGNPIFAIDFDRRRGEAAPSLRSGRCSGLVRWSGIAVDGPGDPVAEFFDGVGGFGVVAIGPAQRKGGNRSTGSRPRLTSFTSSITAGRSLHAGRV